MIESIAFIGLGHMGAPLAQHLIDAGYKLHVFNRSQHKAQSLLDQGALWIDSPQEAYEVASIAISMVSNDEALEEIVFGNNGLSKTLKKDCIHLSMSTVSPNLSRKLESFYLEKHAVYLAAPVLGRPESVQAKTNTIIVAGEETAKTRIRPLLECMTKNIFDFGSEASHANTIKLIVNFLVFAAVESLAEAFTLAQKSHIERDKLWDLVSNHLFKCPVYQNYGKLIMQDEFKAGEFKMSLGLKDMNLVLDVAKEAQSPMPLAHLLTDRLLSGLAKGYENLDTCALALLVRENAGL